MFDAWFLFYLLLPIVALTGWWIGKRGQAPTDKLNNTFNPDYFRGLNFVLNEQPDEAIEVFIRMLKVDSETIETHLALGNLFRRRGEVERAIRIHQNLIARPNLNREQRANALFELAMDYQYSGLLDRAEGLFLELIESNSNIKQAYNQLLTIYQQEKDWHNAIDIAKKLTAISAKSYNPMIAQFYCELAQSALDEGSLHIVKENIKQALRFNANCVRASLIKASFYQQAGKLNVAIKLYKHIESQDSNYISEILAPLHECYRRTYRLNEFIDYLQMLVNVYGNTSSLLLLTELIAERDGEQVAIQFIFTELKARYSVKGVDKLIQYALDCPQDEVYEYLKTMKVLTEKLIKEQPMYQCDNCGFGAKSLYWQCLSCQSWNTMKPVFGVIGE